MRVHILAFAAALLLAFAVVFPSCKPEPAKIEPLKETPASNEVKKLVPDAKTEIKVNLPKKVPIGKTPEIKVVKKENGDVLQITTFKLDKGLYRGLAGYAGVNLSSADIGLLVGGPYFYRIGLDGLVGVKSAGLGISGKILSNTSLGMSYTYQYQNLAPMPGVYLALGF